MVKVGIIGGGFSGLGTAYYLQKIFPGKNNEITIIERGDQTGGLASGIKTKEWNWPIDRVIHHWFTSDKWALEIAREIGLKDKLIIKDTKSSCYYKGKIAELDSATSLLRFPFLNPLDRIRMGVIMALLRVDKNYLRYEKTTSFKFLKKTMGKKAFEVVWKPLFEGKFGKHAEKINGAWFWARVHPRTKSLAYVEGGFQNFSDTLADYLTKKGCKILLNNEIKGVRKVKEKFEVKLKDKKLVFDKIVLAVPLQVALKLYDFPERYKKEYCQLESIGAQYFVLELKKPFLKDGTYWLNVNDSSFPFMMIAEHTNFVNKDNYNGKHLIWVGKYLDYENPLWLLSEKDFLKKIIPYLRKINPDFDRRDIERSFFTRFKNAQPILPVYYSKKIPPITTPVKNMYIANMNHIYPWDRGTNNALGLGERVAKLIFKG